MVRWDNVTAALHDDKSKTDEDIQFAFKKYDLFCLVRGQHSVKSQEKFLVLLCSDCNGSIHFDILRHVETTGNKYVRIVNETQFDVNSYWPMRASIAVPNMSQNQMASFNVEFKSVLDSKSVKYLQPEEAHLHYDPSSKSKEISIPAKLPWFSGLRVNWRTVISTMFANTKRDNFHTLLPPVSVVPFFDSIHAKCRGLNETPITNEERNEIRQMMCKILSGAFAYLEVILKDTLATKRIPDPETKQRDLMDLFRNRCSDSVYANAIVLQFTRMLSIIVSNHSILHEGADTAFNPEDMYRFIGVFTQCCNPMNTVQGWFRYPENKKITEDSNFNWNNFISLYEDVINVAQICRNNTSHAVQNPTDTRGVTPVHVLFLLSFIVAYSSAHPIPPSDYHASYAVVNWY